MFTVFCLSSILMDLLFSQYVSPDLDILVVTGVYEYFCFFIFCQFILDIDEDSHVQVSQKFQIV